jgi:hypothetical protein
MCLATLGMNEECVYHGYRSSMTFNRLGYYAPDQAFVANPILYDPAVDMVLGQL